MVLSAFHDESVREEKYDLMKWLRVFKCHEVDTSAEYGDKEMTQWDCMEKGRCERGPSERRGRGVGSELKPFMCLLSLRFWFYRRFVFKHFLVLLLLNGGLVLLVYVDDNAMARAFLPLIAYARQAFKMR